jgi:RNA polymerase sigma factor (sigma-70 family)
VNDQTDTQLLRAYAEGRSDAAFAELVRRHIDLVHSAALRMVRDPHLAQDVTQGVFIALTKHALQLTDRPVLAGWLHRTAQNIAAQTVRTDVRRRAREQEAAVMNELLSAHPDANWEHIAPHLDDALGELSEPDRDAVLLRYFKNHDLRTVGAMLGISDDAAQKRVSRAVERLREFFAKRGVTVGASGLAVVISANAVQAAPVGLALTISTAAVLTGTNLATTATITATKAIAMTALQKTIVTATIAVLAGVGIYEARQASQVREQNRTLQQQQAPLAEQIQQLQSERDEAKNRLALMADEIERLKSNSSELLKLRGELGRLKAEKNQVRDSAANQSPSVAVSRWTPQQLTNAGIATPLDSLQTMLWAASTGNAEAISSNLFTSLADFGLRSQSDNLRLVRVVGAGPPEFRVLSERKIADNEVQIDVEQKVGAYRFLKTFNLDLYRDGWKVTISESPEGMNPHLDF